MVFEYMDHDLTGIMQRRMNKFSVPEVRAPGAWPFTASRLWCECSMRISLFDRNTHISLHVGA